MSPTPGFFRRRLELAGRACAPRLETLRRGRGGDVAAAFAGALLVTAFAPFDWYPLAVLVPWALLWLLTPLSPRLAARRGFLFAAAEFACGVYWIYISVHEVGGAPGWVAFLMLIVLCAIMAAYSALVCALTVHWAPQPGWRRDLMLFPALWTSAEWLRSWFLSGFPWLSLGYSQIDGPLEGYAPLLGVFGLSLAVVLSAGLLNRAAAQGASARTRVATLTALIAVWAAGAGLATVQWTQPAGPPIPVSLLQGDVPQDEKWAPEIFLPTLDLYRELTDKRWTSRLIVWPEAAIPAYEDEVWSDYLDPLRADARRHGTDLLIGVPTQDVTSDNYYNSVISVGASDGVYHKRHLVPFGEFFPVPEWVRHWLALMDLPYSDFTSGEAEQPLLRAAGYAVGVSICYEDAFGDEVMRDLPEAAFLVNVSNDGWFGDSIALPQHLQIARMRAAETGRYLLRATNTGLTAIVDEHGALRAVAPRAQVATLDGTLQPLAGRTPLLRWGNAAVVALSLLSVLAAVWAERRAGGRLP